jgi:hypothetical protein
MPLHRVPAYCHLPRGVSVSQGSPAREPSQQGFPEEHTHPKYAVSKMRVQGVTKNSEAPIPLEEKIRASQEHL